LHLVGGGSILQTTGEESASSGWAILVDFGTPPSAFSSMSVGCSSCTDIEFRSPNHSFAGTLQNGATGVKFNGGGAAIYANLQNNKLFFDCSWVLGQAFINILSSDDSDVLRGPNCWSGGSTGMDAQITIGSSGRASGDRNYFQIPGTTIVAGGWMQTIPTGQNGTFLISGNGNGTYETSRVSGCPTPPLRGYELYCVVYWRHHNFRCSVRRRVEDQEQGICDIPDCRSNR
jgi:hypothetical protein